MDKRITDLGRASRINNSQGSINRVRSTDQAAAFRRILKQKAEVKFSKHASQRLTARNISLTETEMKRLSEGVNKAKTKGVKEALIMMDNKVFVASVKNNTVITASTDEQLKENVFTNIDGAVIV